MMNELYARLVAALVVARVKLDAFLKREDGAVDIVAIVVLIGVAVLLAIVFKDQLGRLISDLFSTISGNSTDVVNTRL